MLPTIPLALRSSIETASATLFLGAGIGHNALQPDGTPAPTAAELAVELCKHFGIDIPKDPQLPTVAQVVEGRKGGKAELHAFLGARLVELQPDENLVWLLSLPWRAIYTTNYDRVVQRAYELQSDPIQTPVTVASTADIVSYVPALEVPVYHLHGSLFEGERPFALITQRDYATFRDYRSSLFELLKTSHLTGPILYVGYSNQDPNWAMVMAEVEAEFLPNTPPESFRVSPQTETLEVEALQSVGVATIESTLNEFVAALKIDIDSTSFDPSIISQIADLVPSDLKSAFGESPAAVARLLSSWEYVNQADFSGHANLQEFLEGDHANWALIGRQDQFERDVEEELFDGLADVATSPDPLARSLLITAPAGYGVSTVLKSLGVKLVQQRAGRVFFHRSSQPILEGDVEFASRLFGEPTFFIVDNAADHRVSLPPALNRLRALTERTCVLMGERLNEWRQARIRLNPREFEILPLSDGEIERLLKCLESHHSLGNLENLSEELRFSTVRERHQKELLVAMKEATEGKSFSAIIEDEYQSLSSDTARRIYGASAAFYRTRSLMRESLVASIVGLDLSELVRLCAEELEGVVRLVDIDPVTGMSCLRPRHHLIAQIVWDRCLTVEDRSTIMLTAVKRLNLNYSLDHKAFEALVKDDEAVESIGDFDLRTDFFEVACRKDPRSPYVRQHFARMLRRAKKYDLALQQVKTGLELNDDVRILYHTKGMIHADMAFESDSMELARRHFLQSEESFQRAIRLFWRDEYGYQGLAQLYLDWARHVTDEPERTKYLQKCEETVHNGLLVVKNKEHLWITSAKISDYLGDSPEIVEALKKAIQHAPTSSSVSRYVLARHYFDDGELSAALDVLKPVVSSASDDYRSFALYAEILNRLGRPLEESIAILRLAEGPGSRDARYVSEFGGCLFMSGEFTEAAEVFERAKRQSFHALEMNKPYFIPYVEGAEQILEGIVQRVRPGFTFISSTGFPDFYCQGSRFGKLIMREGLRVSFHPAFSVKGAMALKVGEAGSA